MREALEALDVLVVIDVALTETARLADYVLPASSQFEKWEATFFTLEFPDNFFHLRAPLFDALPGTLPEAEIHRRLVRALGAVTDDDVALLHAAAARIPAEGRGPYADAFFQTVAERPHLQALVPVVLYETLGPTLPAGAAATAILWGASHLCAMGNSESMRRAGYDGDPREQGERLFEALLTNRSGIVFTRDEYDATWDRLCTPDRRVNLVVPELMGELSGLRDEDPARRDAAYPFVLSAGERRTNTANTIFRDPRWRKKDQAGALRMNPDDAARLGIADGGRARVTTKRATVETVVEVTETLQPGHVSLPNGLGVCSPDDVWQPEVHGVAPNELTASEDRDWLAGTPWHKHVAARIETAR
jgi:anaerobic selenocysteine-containing dehydrogenase